MRLHLGVVDLPYAYEQAVGKGKKRGGRAPASRRARSRATWKTNTTRWKSSSKSTAEEIAKDLEEGLAGTLESLLMGAPPSLSAFGSAESAIDKRFRDFLTNKEMERLGYPGVPTEASGSGKRVGGINHRLRNPYARSNPARPSFVDTALYENSFKSWVD